MQKIILSQFIGYSCDVIKGLFYDKKITGRRAKTHPYINVLKVCHGGFYFILRMEHDYCTNAYLIWQNNQNDKQDNLI